MSRDMIINHFLQKIELYFIVAALKSIMGQQFSFAAWLGRHTQCCCSLPEKKWQTRITHKVMLPMRHIFYDC